MRGEQSQPEILSSAPEHCPADVLAGGWPSIQCIWVLLDVFCRSLVMVVLNRSCSDELIVPCYSHHHAPWPVAVIHDNQVPDLHRIAEAPQARPAKVGILKGGTVLFADAVPNLLRGMKALEIANRPQPIATLEVARNRLIAFSWFAGS